MITAGAGRLSRGVPWRRWSGSGTEPVTVAGVAEFRIELADDEGSHDPHQTHCETCNVEDVHPPPFHRIVIDPTVIGHLSEFAASAWCQAGSAANSSMVARFAVIAVCHTESRCSTIRPSLSGC